MPVLGKGSQTVCVYLEASSAGSGKGLTDGHTNAINIVNLFGINTIKLLSIYI
jgi:hypothetical protein